MLPAVGVPAVMHSFEQVMSYPEGTVASSAAGMVGSYRLVRERGMMGWMAVGGALWDSSLIGHTLTVISYPPGTVYEGSRPPVGTRFEKPEAYAMLAKLPVGTKVLYHFYGDDPKYATREVVAERCGGGRLFNELGDCGPITILSYPSTPPESYKVYCSWLCGPWDVDPGHATQDDAVRWWQKQMKPYMNMACYRPGGDSFQSSYLIDSAGKRVASLPEAYARINSTPEKQPMKIEVFTTPAPKTPEPLRLKLRQSTDGAEIVAVDSGGNVMSYICTFKDNGTLNLETSVSPSLGLQLDDRGRIRVA